MLKTGWAELVIAALCLTCTLQGCVGARTDEWKEITTLAESVKAPSPLSDKEREDKAYQLAVLIRQKVGKPAPKKLIAELADMMSDSDETVRFWTVGALQNLGPQADLAIPALERALAEARAADPPGQGRSGIHLDDAIQHAMEKITQQRR